MGFFCFRSRSLSRDLDFSLINRRDFSTHENPPIRRSKKAFLKTVCSTHSVRLKCIIFLSERCNLLIYVGAFAYRVLFMIECLIAVLMFPSFSVSIQFSSLYNENFRK